MLDQHLDRFDRILLTASVLGALLFGGALIRDDLLLKLFGRITSGEIVGHVVSSQNDVRWRSRLSLTWYDTIGSEDLHELDSIFTGSNSKTTIALNNNQSIDLDENSLVVLRTKGGEVLIDLQLGSVLANVKPGQMVKVLHEGEVIEVKNQRSPMRISKTTSGKLTVQNKSGILPLGEKQKTALPIVKIVPEKLVELAKVPAPVEHGPEKPPAIAPGRVPTALHAETKVVLQFKAGAETRAPASAAKLITNPPRLEWAKVEDAREYVVEISANPRFENPLIYDPLDGSDLVWDDVKPGRYFWRTKARGFRDDETPSGEAAKLLVKLPSPDLEAPEIKNETTESPGELELPKALKAVWGRVPMAKKYRFIASENGIQKMNIITDKTFAEVKIAPEKNTEIKVAVVDNSGQPISDFTSLSRQFKRELIVRAPEIILPEDKTTVVAFDKKQIDPLLFTWRAAEGVKNYQLQFSADADFKHILSEKNVSSNTFILKEKVSNKSVYWRVRSQFETRNSNWSAPRSYELQNGR